MDYEFDDLNKKTYLTGVLGNELYNAPELTGGKKYRYTNTVGNSLCIILLEMLHPMRNTELRRRILIDARTKEITLPESMEGTKGERVIRYTLKFIHLYEEKILMCKTEGSFFTFIDCYWITSQSAQALKNYRSI